MKRIRLVMTHYILTKWGRRWKNRAAVEQWQEKRIRLHVEKVRQRSKFYRELWAGIPSKEWRSFPVIGKPEMMENFDQLNTAGITKEQAFAEAYEAENSRNFKPTLQGVTVGLSSGTSGNRGFFSLEKKSRLPGPARCWQSFCRVDCGSGRALHFFCGQIVICMNP